MRPRTLLVLFLVVAGLGAFIWVFERDLPSADEMRDRDRRVLVMEVDEVEELTLSAAGRVVRLERASKAEGSAAGAGREWTLTEPALGPADSDEVETFLEQIAGLVKERTLEDGSREDLGLTSPRAEIAIGLPTGEVALKLGSPVPASDNAIVELGSGPPFYVVRDSLYEDVSRDPDAWRGRDAIPVERARIQRIEVVEPPTGVSLERAGDVFRLVTPLDDEADDAEVSSLLTSLVDMEIDEFLDEPGQAPELERPLASVRLSVEGRADPILVSIAGGGTDVEESSDSSRFAVRVDGRTFLAETDLALQLARPASDWQSPRWSARRSFEIDRVRVGKDGEELALERRDGNWFRDGEEVGYSAVDGFLRAVTEATGSPSNGTRDSVDQPFEAESGAPALEVTLEFGEDRERLRLFAAGGGYLAERSGRPVGLTMTDGAVDDVLARLEELKAAPALAPAESADASPD